MFDRFTKEKSDFLGKKDKSRKGSVDGDIKSVIKIINSKEDYCTTSSCAGRIVLLEIKSRNKNDCNWIFVKHNKVAFNEINKALIKYNNNIKNNKTNKKMKYKGARSMPSAQKFAEGGLNKTLTKNDVQIWLKQQPIILHVACRNLDAAKRLLDASRRIFKHSGIIGITDKKATVEIIGNERIETVIADKNFIADGKYLKNLIRYANKNFEENKRKSKNFFSLLNGL